MKRRSEAFADRVRAVVKAIPRGHILSYGEVARRAGSAGAARAVGTILSKNYDPRIPCHRVIRSDGKLGNYNRGPEQKLKRLKQEGAWE